MLEVEDTPCIELEMSKAPPLSEYKDLKLISMSLAENVY